MMLLRIPDNLLGKRDRALFLVGIAGAFRRSELVAINVGDLEFVKEGMRILIRQSKTDQTQKGMIVDIDYGNFEHTCPVKALKAWLEAAGLERRALFRKIAKGHTRDHIERPAKFRWRVAHCEALYAAGQD